MQLDLGIKYKMLLMETKVNKRSTELKDLISEVYEVFASYDSIEDLDVCLTWYTTEQIQLLKSVSVSKIDTVLAKKLLWESKDHWSSTNVYKYFLPRILEVISPPEFQEDLFPAHLIEVLEQLQFKSWFDEEKKVVLKLLKYLSPLIYEDIDDSAEFNEGLSSLLV